jgi:putative CRISPR-associated protein (TIGR02619 family)
MNIYHTVVITGGISIFGAHNVYRKWTDQLNLFHFERANPLPLTGKTEEEALAEWRDACRIVDSQLAHNDPKNVSAEFSLLYALRTQNRLTERPRVILLHTITLGGEAAAILLERLLPAYFKAEVRLQGVGDVDVNDRAALNRSLGNFMEKVASALTEGEPATTCFAPVGGYKVMTSLGYLAGAYLGFPTAYLQEDNQVLHEIPAIPVQLQADTLRAVAPLMRRLLIGGGVTEFSALSADEQKIIVRYPYLFETHADLVDLNAFARFVTGRPEHRALFGSQVYLSITARQAIGDTNLHNYALRQVQELLKRLQLPQQFRNELHHEATFDNLKNADFALYKGAVHRAVFYAAYRWDKKQQCLYINRIWLNHDYTRDAEAGNGFFGDGDGWEIWSEASS